MGRIRATLSQGPPWGERTFHASVLPVFCKEEKNLSRLVPLGKNYLGRMRCWGPSRIAPQVEWPGKCEVLLTSFHSSCWGGFLGAPLQLSTSGSPIRAVMF